jgi:hypothetical protein
LAAGWAGLGCAWAAPPAVTYLRPAKFVATRGESVGVCVETGAPLTAQVTDWPADDLRWFYVLAAGTRENHPTVRPAGRDTRSVPVNVTQPGVTVVGLDKKPAVTTMSGTDLRTFLSQNVAQAEAVPIFQRLGSTPVRVRRIESAATLIRAPGTGGDNEGSGAAMSKTGQAVEIRPLFDPTSVVVGSDLPVRVYVGGSTKAGAKVQASSLAAGQTVAKIADRTGSTFFRITHPGLWRIEFHDARPLDGDADADWVLYSATLTFEVTGEGGGP